MANLKKAFEWLKEGKRVRQKHWENPKMYLFIDGVWGPRFSVFGSEDNGLRPNLKEEYLEQDWEIYEEESRAEEVLKKIVEEASIPNKDEAIWLSKSKIIKVLERELN